MIIDIKQLYKELFSAKFVIDNNNTVIGDIFVQGNITSMEGRVSINFDGLSIEMLRGKKNLPKGQKAYRPYDVRINGNNVGSVFQTNVREGGLFSSYPVHKVYLNGEDYTLYSVCFGKDGARSPVYYRENQVLEIHKSSVIYNELHIYRGFLKNKDYALVFVLLCCYSYVLSFFRPGEKPIKSVRKIIYTTTNKYELAKYNPDFIASIKD